MGLRDAQPEAPKESCSCCGDQTELTSVWQFRVCYACFADWDAQPEHFELVRILDAAFDAMWARGERSPEAKKAHLEKSRLAHEAYTATWFKARQASLRRGAA